MEWNMKKNLFLLPVIFLAAIFCFSTVSCGSGYSGNGEVSFTFSGTALNKIMARSVAEDFD